MFEKLIELLRDAVQGNEEAIARGDLQDTVIGKPSTPTLSARSLQADHYRACVIQVSAEILGLRTTAELCKEYISVINVLAEKFHNVRLQERTLEVGDYVDTLLEMVQEVNSKMVPIESLLPPKQDQGGEHSSQVQTSPAPDPVPNPRKQPRESAEEPADPDDNEAVAVPSGLPEPGPTGLPQPVPSDLQVPGPSGLPAPGPSTKRPKLKGKVKGQKSQHYEEQKCPVCRVGVVHLRRHLLTMHSKRNQRISVSQVEAFVQTARQSKKSSGQVQHKSNDGTIRVTSRSKEVCPICQSVTCYLSTHLQRVHKFKKDSDRYKDAIQRRRKYLGKRKELKRVQKSLQKKKSKPPSEKTGPPPPDEALRKRRPLQILIEEAEMSEGGSDELPDIIPPTPPRAPSPEAERRTTEQTVSDDPCPPSPEVDQPTEDQTDSDEDYEQQEEEDEDSDDEEDFSTLKNYYANATAKTNREKFYVMFYDHLKNIIGGCKKERQAILHAQHVRRIHDHLDPEHKDKTFESILEDGGLNVWKKWAKPLLDNKEMRPGSVRSYLLSMAKFCNFVEDHVVHKVRGFPPISEEICNRVRSVVSRFKGMSSSINKEYVHLKWEKRMQDEANAVPVALIQQVMDSEVAREAVRFLTISFNSKPTEKMFLSIRDFLLARLELENCQRPGPLESVTIEEFNLAKEVEGKIVMNVARHKTSKAGPAPITMSQNMYTNLKAYVRHVRCHFASEDENALFVTRDRKAFPSGTLGKRISAWWKKATGRDISSTQLRKVGSTETMDEDLATQAAVQTLMTHRRTTAEEHYQILNKTKQAVKGHAALAKKLGLKETQATTLAEDVQAQTKSGEQESPTKKGLTEMQLNDIDILFSEQIATNAALTLTQVRNVMSESVNLLTELENQTMVKRVYNRVKYLQRKHFEEGLEKVSTKQEEGGSEWVASVSTAVSGPTRRFEWSEADKKVIAKTFKNFHKVPTKKEIYTLFQTDVKLIDIAERNTIQRCYEKVKTLFRRRNK